MSTYFCFTFLANTLLVIIVIYTFTISRWISIFYFSLTSITQGYIFTFETWIFTKLAFIIRIIELIFLTRSSVLNNHTLLLLLFNI